ncbi:uncharacterized protein LOC125739915 isoform X1 [Brienomyrus brachyistius]|uniref:uncharacterized protein LOC125739915 isoform X1 n=1 Tax=Brienomyrus brachyistius TaxID=42636 RepID=UPI0020B21C8D|nr:uncharacterized protein LOC125739915 isoform X1 [Brienomyrus brachyistius]
MEGSVLVFLLCLQAGLIAGSPDCADRGGSRRADGTACRSLRAAEESAKILPSPHRAPSGQLWAASHAQPAWLQRARRQTDHHSKQKKTERPGSFSTSNVTWNPEWLKGTAISGTKNHLEKGSSHQKVPGHNGVASETSHSEPPHLAEWERRQQPGFRKKSRKKPRVGSFSLLSHTQDMPPKVTRVRRHLSNQKKKNPGKGSPIGHEEVKPKRNHKKITC